MLSRREFVGVAAGVTAALALGAARTARAQPNLRVEILVLHARKDPSGPHRDARVPQIPQLLRPPFNEYNSYSFVDDVTLKLDLPKAADPWKGKPSARYALVTGKAMEVAVIDLLPDRRYQLGVALGKDASDVVRYSAPLGEPFFLGGQGYKDGILVIGITLRG
jgi:hypothetical protein